MDAHCPKITYIYFVLGEKSQPFVVFVRRTSECPLTERTYVSQLKPSVLFGPQFVFGSSLDELQNEITSNISRKNAMTSA